MIGREKSNTVSLFSNFNGTDFFLLSIVEFVILTVIRMFHIFFMLIIGFSNNFIVLWMSFLLSPCELSVFFSMLIGP